MYQALCWLLAYNRDPEDEALVFTDLTIHWKRHGDKVITTEIVSNAYTC